jgi:hypothetical protein
MNPKSTLVGLLLSWVIYEPPIVCKICNPNSLLKNGYCVYHSTSGMAYIEEDYYRVVG